MRERAYVSFEYVPGTEREVEREGESGIVGCFLRPCLRLAYCPASWVVKGCLERFMEESMVLGKYKTLGR